MSLGDILISRVGIFRNQNEGRFSIDAPSNDRKKEGNRLQMRNALKKRQQENVYNLRFHASFSHTGHVNRQAMQLIYRLESSIWQLVGMATRLLMENCPHART